MKHQANKEILQQERDYVIRLYRAARHEVVRFEPMVQTMGFNVTACWNPYATLKQMQELSQDLLTEEAAGRVLLGDPNTYLLNQSIRGLPAGLEVERWSTKLVKAYWSDDVVGPQGLRILRVTETFDPSAYKGPVPPLGFRGEIEALLSSGLRVVIHYRLLQTPHTDSRCSQMDVLEEVDPKPNTLVRHIPNSYNVLYAAPQYLIGRGNKAKQLSLYDAAKQGLLIFPQEGA